MMYRVFTLFTTAVALACASAATESCTLLASDLTLNYRQPSGAFVDEVPLFNWAVTATGSETNQSQSAYDIQCSTDAQFGSGTLWDSGKVMGTDTLQIPYKGSPLGSRQQVFWRVKIWDQNGAECSWSKAARFEMTLLKDGDWKAQWVAAEEPKPAESDCDVYKDRTAPLFRKDIALEQPAAAVTHVYVDRLADCRQIDHARVYVSGLGYYKLTINGVPIGDSELDPGWTDYNETVLYATYDVTSAFTKDDKYVVGVKLGNGWWNPLPLRLFGRWNMRETLSSGVPMFLLQLEITYGNGTVQVVGSDTTWKTSGSPLLQNDLYLGNLYDNRLSAGISGWNQPGFDDSKWKASVPAVDSQHVGRLTAQYLDPVKRMAPTPATLVSKTGNVYVYDAGRNMAGICTFEAQGHTGQQMQMVYGELLFPNGSVNYWTSVAGQDKHAGAGGPCSPDVAKQMDTYIFGSNEKETWTPEFTWHGFRYIQIEADVDTIAVTCYPLRSDVPVVGEFKSSSTILNQIHQLALNSQTSNMISVQSDCPHRERLGGDALMSGEAFIANFDMSGFYSKRMRDFVQGQRANGGYTEVAPFMGMSTAGLGNASGPIGWQTVVPVGVMWMIKYYGQVELASELYPSLKQYVELLDTNPPGILNGLGDWMAVEHKAVALTGLSFVMQSYQAFSNISTLIGQHAAAATYAAKAQNIAGDMNAYLDNSTGVYADAHFNLTQCGQALPLFMQIVPEAVKAKVVTALKASVTNSKGLIQVGGFAIPWLLLMLSEYGMQDLALAMMTSKEYPSFGYMIDNNATTIWESWFFSDNVYSHNHAMFSGSELWLYQSLGGIQVHPGAIGSNRFIIRPQPAPGLDYVEASINSPRGKVSTSWHIESGTFHFNCTLPPNTQADIWLPSNSSLETEFFATMGSGLHSFSVPLSSHFM